MKFDNLVHRLRTPLETINILGCGGIKMGTLCECWGPPGGGKSTFCYQTGSYYQKDYPDGYLHLIDAENSFDEVRMRSIFDINIDSTKFKVDPAPTIEDAFEKIVEGAALAKKEGVPYLAIVDSWTVLNTKSALENVEEHIKNPEKTELSMNSGGMMYKPRAGRHFLNLLMPMMYQAPMTVLIINQATTEMGRFSATIGSGGGYGLKHDIQFSMCFTKKDSSIDGDVKLGFMNTTLATSQVDITKSKFIPEISGIPMYINIADGGTILPKKELVALAKAKGIIQQKGSWYTVEGMDKNYRFSDIEDIENIENIFRALLVSKYRSEYRLVDLYYKEKDKRKEALTLEVGQSNE